MPTYDYRCTACDHLTSRAYPIAKTPRIVDCESCQQPANKIISQVSVKLSNMSKVEKLDPRYDKMVDAQMQNSNSADPDNYLRKMRPFSDSTD